MAVKKVIESRKTKRKNRKWKEWDFEYIIDKHMLKKAGTIIKLVLE